MHIQTQNKIVRFGKGLRREAKIVEHIQEKDHIDIDVNPLKEVLRNVQLIRPTRRNKYIEF